MYRITYIFRANKFWMFKRPGWVFKYYLKRYLKSQKDSKDKFDSYVYRDMKFQNIYITTHDAIKLGCWILAPKEINVKTIFCIFLHDRGMNRHDFTRLLNLDMIMKCNLVLIIPDYRSFGDSEGEFTMAATNLDIKAVHKLCLQRFDYEPVFIGYGFGGAVALEYLHYARFDNKIILISTFTHILDLWRTKELWNFLYWFFYKAQGDLYDYLDYNNCRNIRYAKKENVLILHGELDGKVPKKFGRVLSMQINCQYKELPNHNHFSILKEPDLYKNINKFVEQ